MSFNRLNFDNCQYKQALIESTGPGLYQLNTPSVSCDPCYPNDLHVRLQRGSGSLETCKSMIDIDSELLNLTRPSSKCPVRKYIPMCPGYNADGYPCGQGVVPTCKKITDKGGEVGMHSPEKCPSENHQSLPTPNQSWKDCSLNIDDTRISNPPCNLRGTGINRWEWLCLNPQERVEVPFDYNISNRIVVKDNHRPCVPVPLDQQPAFPKGGDLPCKPTTSTCSNPTDPPSVAWQQCDSIGNY